MKALTMIVMTSLLAMAPLARPSFAQQPEPAKPVTPTTPAIPATPASTQTLNWNELVRRPEFWPTECTIQREMKFRGGNGVQAGQKLEVLGIQGNQISLVTPDGLSFTVKPEETDALSVANATFSKLTPAQRELTYAQLLQRTELWPYRVAAGADFNLGPDGKIAKGEPLLLLGVEGNNLLVLAEKINIRFNVEAQQTDLMQQARQMLGNGDEPVFSNRVTNELSGKLLDSNTGEVSNLDPESHPRYFAFYRSAGWCGPCRQFSPTLVKAYNDLKKQHPDFELIFVSCDESVADLKAYAKEEHFPWRAIKKEDQTKLPLIAQHFGQGIPQLIVIDPAGKLLVNSDQVGREAAIQKLTALLKQPAVTKKS